MECLSPISIARPNGHGNADRICVPCGRCVACLQRRRAHWSFRLSEELRNSSNAYFLTLTYDDVHLTVNENGIPSVNKRDCQLFLKRLRKAIPGTPIRYYLVSEYGSRTYRPHYHAIIFNVHNDKSIATNAILNSWQNGNVKLGTVTPASMHYVTKYCINALDAPFGATKVFALMSKRPAIGKSYLSRAASFHEADDRFYVVYPGGIKGSLPRYYAEKLYTKEARERHADQCRSKNKDPVQKWVGNPDPFRYDSDVKSQFVKSVKQKSQSLII